MKLIKGILLLMLCYISFTLCVDVSVSSDAKGNMPTVGGAVKVSWKVSDLAGDTIENMRIEIGTSIIAIGARSTFLVGSSLLFYDGRLETVAPPVNNVYSIIISHLQINDSNTLTGLFWFKTNSPLSQNIRIEVIAVDPTEPGSNAGAIAGGVVGAIVVIAVVVVILYFVLYRRKNKPVTAIRSENVDLKSGQGYGSSQVGHCAPAGTGISQDTKKQPEVYAQVGHGRGRKVDENEPREKQPPVLYAQVKTDEDGYPATGLRTTPAPPKPVHDKLRKGEGFL